MDRNTKKYTFHVQGMHCNACVLLVENELGETPGITHVTAHLDSQSVSVEGDFGNETLEHITTKLTAPLREHGYIVSLEKQGNTVQWSDFYISIPIAIAFVALFVALQEMGIIHLVGEGDVTYGTAFFIGIIASLSTCMAVVGGLVLSMSATFAKEGDTIRPQLMFHGGRIASFFIFGGIIGALGAVFTLSTQATFVLSFVIGIVMLILGINLLGIFHFAKKLQPSMPRFIAKHAHDIAKVNHALTPLLVGIATFFLPCGFTQSMQLYTLTTGSFIEGGLTMLAFALGTFPVLALISFSSLSIQNSARSGIFFKSAGLVVILFALFNIINSFVVIGLIPPVFNF